MKLRYRKLSVLLAAGLTASLLASTPGFAEGSESQESQVETAEEVDSEDETSEEEENPDEEYTEDEYSEEEYPEEIDGSDTGDGDDSYEDDSTAESDVESAVEYVANTAAGTAASSENTTAASGESAQSGTATDAAAQSTADTTAQSSTTDAAAQSTAAPAEEAPKRPEYRGLDFISLGDYKGLTAEVDPIEITDEDIDERINQEIRNSEEASETLTEGTVEEGDIANIDFTGKKDGVAFDGGTAEGYDLEIGSGSFIDGFEDGLIGVAIGDTVDLNLTFPEQYGNADLAGQDVVFTVKVNSVSRAKDMDDELASLLSDGEAATVDEYREYVKGILEEEALENRKAQVEADLLGQAAENITVDSYPQDLVGSTSSRIITSIMPPFTAWIWERCFHPCSVLPKRNSRSRLPRWLRKISGRSSASMQLRRRSLCFPRARSLRQLMMSSLRRSAMRTEQLWWMNMAKLS